MAQLNLKNSYHYAPTPLSAGAQGASEEGKRHSARSLNAIKHGGCSKTLILPHESIGDWELVLKHWCEVYRPKEDTLEFDFVLKVAQAEFRRLRADRNYDDFLAAFESTAPFAWTPEEIKRHDLMQRYLTAATREFERQYRMLEHHYKTHKPIPAEETTQQEPVAEEPPPCGIHIVGGSTLRQAAPCAAAPVPPKIQSFEDSDQELETGSAE